MHRHGDVDDAVILEMIRLELRGRGAGLGGQLCGLWMRGSEVGGWWVVGGGSVAGVLMRIRASVAF